MKVVECPEGKFYVCVKMFGGGMGDQIRRYCEAIPREVHRTNLPKSYFSIFESSGTVWKFENFAVLQILREINHNGDFHNTCA